MALLSSGGSAWATWNKIADFTSIGNVTASYFFDENTGLISFKSNQLNFNILRTSDGGKTWATTVMPPVAATGQVWCTDLWFTDSLRGWATFEDPYSTSTLWLTTNGGLNWSNTSMVKRSDCVRETSHAVVVTHFMLPGGIDVSTDGGVTWTNKPGIFGAGIDFTDDLHLATGGAQTSTFCYSNDGGITWASSTAQNNEAWGMAGMKGTSTFIAAPEDLPGVTNSKIYRSNDNGVTWSVLGTLPVKNSGDMQSTRDAVFFQCINSGTWALFRSVNYGVSWTSIGGVAAGFDVRFSVVGCGTIYLFNSLGGVWKTTDGGDGYLLGACSRPIDSLGSMTASLCDSQRKRFVIHNPFGDGDTVYLVDLRILDTTRGPYTSGAIRMDSNTRTPRIFYPNDSAVFILKWNPKLLNRVGTDSTRVRMIVYEPKRAKWDTLVLPVRLITLPITAEFAHNGPVNVGSRAACDQVDTAVILRNQGCAPIKVTAISLSRAMAWSFDPVALPTMIPVGGSLRIPIHYIPHDNRFSDDALTFAMECGNRDTSTSVYMSGSGRAVDPLGTLAPIDIHLASTCGHVDTSMSIVNAGCDTVWVLDLNLINGKEWSMLDSTGGSAYTLPLAIPPGLSLRWKLRFAPKAAITFTDSLFIRCALGTDTSQAWFGLSGKGSSPDPLPWKSLSKFDFRPTATCSSRDTTIAIHNAGCDTVAITAANINAADWTLLQMDGSPLTFPLMIPADSFARIRVHFAPHATGGLAAQLFFTYWYKDAGGTRTTVLTGSGTAKGLFEYGRAIDFGSVSICSSRDSLLEFTNTTCNDAVIDSLQITGPFSLLDLGILPLKVKSGGTAILHFRYRPLSKFVEKWAAALKLIVNGGATYDTIQFEGRGVAGTSWLTSIPEFVTKTFTQLSECEPGESTSYTFTNPGCDTLTIDAATLTGTVPTGISLSVKQALPIKLIGGGALSLTVTRDAIPLKYDGSLKITGTFANSAKLDTSAEIHATVVNGTRTFVMDGAPLNFGTGRRCTAPSGRVIYHNDGCLPLTISEREFYGSGFTLKKKPGSPLILPPNEWDTLDIVYDGATLGACGGSISVKTNGDQNPDRSIPVSATILGVDSVGFGLTFSKPSATAGEIVDLEIRPDRHIDAHSLFSIDGDLSYFSDYYSVAAMHTMPGLTIDTNESHSGTESSLHFRINGSSDITLDPSTPVVTAKVLTMLTDTLQGTMKLQSVVMNASDPTYGSCILRAMTSSFSSSTVLTCGDQIIAGELKQRRILTLNSVRPNPINTSTGSQLILSLNTTVDGIAKIVVVDVMGQAHLTTELAVQHAGNSQHPLDLKNLPAGSYFFTVLFNTESGMDRTSGSFTIVK